MYRRNLLTGLKEPAIAMAAFALASILLAA
jgi:hypothetical protein